VLWNGLAWHWHLGPVRGFVLGKGVCGFDFICCCGIGVGGAAHATRSAWQFKTQGVHI
jgi:hypothetical protein